jgi:AhpD family alkylhydroperoxidase
MQARIENPALTVPGALQALQKLGTAVKHADVPATTLYLIELRASQINGCSVCVDMHSRELKAAGEPDERISCVAAWREASYYTDAERAALALTEAATRLADRSDPVPDDVWQEAARHYDEPQLAALVIAHQRHHQAGSRGVGLRVREQAAGRTGSLTDTQPLVASARFATIGCTSSGRDERAC